MDPQRGSTCRLSADSYPSHVFALLVLRFSAMYRAAICSMFMASPSKIPDARPRWPSFLRLGFYVRHVAQNPIDEEVMR